MRDSTGYMVLIFFCFTFYFLCFLSLQQQIKQKGSDLTQFVCDSLGGIVRSRRMGRDAESDLLENEAFEINDFVNRTDRFGDISYIGEKLNGSAHTPGTKRKEDVSMKDERGARRLLQLPRCPHRPPGLAGIFNLSETNMKPVKYGGTFAPSGCRAVENVAIIVPYRDREHHLKLFLKYMHTFLQKQLLQYTIFVVEMALPTQFNRGLLANVGFMNAVSAKKYSCFIFHDVDLLPMNDTNMYVCGDKPRHMSVKNSKFGYKLPYEDYFGGIVAFRQQQFANINGFSNMYFGWGAEDDDLRRRLEYFNKTYERLQADIGYYNAVAHGRDTSNPVNPIGQKLLDNSHRRLLTEGLNSVTYTRLALEFRELYTWIYVRANETQYMEPYTNLQAPRMPFPSGIQKYGNMWGKRVPFII